jgi:phosphoglycolate phosphatase
MDLVADRRVPNASLIPADAYIFDIDGTLLNSRDAVHYHAFLSGLREVFGIEGALENVPVHGNTDLGIVRAVLEREGKAAGFESKLPAALAIMRREAERNRAGFDPELCPSIVQLLGRLHAERKLLGVASGNLETIAWAKLEAAGIHRYFSFGSFSDCTELREHIFQRAITQARELHAKSNSEPTICFVGDTPADILAARANNTPIIAVATGIFSREQLAEHRPDLLLSCCSDLF